MIPRVLLLEPSLTVRMHLGDAFELAGFEVIRCATLEEAEGALRRERAPSVIVAEPVLPDGDGELLLKLLRDLRVEVPVMLFTDRPVDGTVALQKPYEPERVVAQARALLGPDETAELQAGPDQGASLLVVDDSLTFLERIREFFGREGYRVATARSGEEALEMLEHVQVDCVLLDMQMAGISGLETCRRLKANPSTRDIPVVMLTAHDAQATVIEALDEGADDFIAKSSDFGLLRGRVRAQLRRRHFEAENRQMREELHRREMEAREARASRELAEIRAALLADLERKNRELERAREQAVRESRFKSRFLANMSHELRTPLNAIIGFSELLEQGAVGELEDRQLKYIRSVLTSGRHLLALVNDVLDLSKVEAGRMTLDREWVPLAIVADSVWGVVQPLAEKRRVQLELNLPDELPPVHADPVRLKQVLYNLLSNGIKFTPSGGRVTLRARPNGERVVIEVVDTGVGIREEDMPRLFREFEQIEPVSGERAEGTGLGLALTRRLVELHGGRISVESRVGKGSIFRVELPIDGPAGLEEAAST